MFETRGKINDQIIGNMKGFLISRIRKRTLFAAAAILLVIALFYRIFSEGNVAAVLVCLSVLLVLEYFWIVHNAYKRFMRRMAETGGKREVEYATSFREDGMALENVNTGGQTSIAYDVFTGLVETPEVFVLFTKSSQMAFVFKDCLDQDACKAFRTFILGKCRNLKERKRFLD